MAAPLGYGNCRYTPITVAGTTTVSPTPPTIGAPTVNPVFYGMNCAIFGTSPVFSAYDVIVVNTGTNTNTLLSGTFTAAGQSVNVINGFGARVNGALVVVVTGTANALNVLWD